MQRSVPCQAYRALPKAGPGGTPHGYYRLRYDHVDAGGKVSIRRASRMHHRGIGAAHRGREILAVTDTSSVTVIELRTREVLSAHDIDPARDYWRSKQRSPGRAAWAARCPQARALRMMLRAWPSVRRGLRDGSCYGDLMARTPARHIV